jgi:hypothetical protein
MNAWLNRKHRASAMERLIKRWQELRRLPEECRRGLAAGRRLTPQAWRPSTAAHASRRVKSV